MSSFAGVLFIFLIFSLAPAAAQSPQYRRPAPAQEECPQGRQIRAQKAYPSTMTDCEVLDADTAAENRRLARPAPQPRAPGQAPLAPPPTANQAASGTPMASPAASDHVRKNPPSEQDPYAEAYRSQKLQRYNEERDSYLTMVFNLYFALGCKVFPDETTVMPLLGIEYRSFFNGNLELAANEVQSITAMTKTKALAGREMAAQPDACDYFKQHPEKVLAFRKAAQAAMGF
jgi:hypothetical protein